MKPGLCLGLALLCAAMRAQETEHRIGNYRAATAYEFGYRAAVVDGNEQMYRSTVNYNNGIRLFDGFLRLNSRDGHGGFLDEIILTTSGSGGDPYQSNSLRIEKNRWYRYDMGFRIVNYHNRLLSLTLGEHAFNTERIFQSHDLTLFPQRKVQLLFGFDRNNQNGPAFSSHNFDVREAAFPRDRFFVFADDVRRLNNTWRVGANATAGPVKLSLQQGWDFFKDDTAHSAPNLRRSDPVHGLTPFSRLNVYTDANRRFAVNARLVYTGGERNFVLDENISSLNPATGVLVTRQALVLGQGRRSQGSGDLTLAVQPTDKWAVANTTSINQTRITGDSAFVEVRTPSSGLDPNRDEAFFSFLGIRLITNATDINFRPVKVVGFHAGYHYSIRRIQSRGRFEERGGTPFEGDLYSFENSTHSGLGGVRLRPLIPLSILLDIEVGRAGRPFTPVSEKRFHAETAQVQWKSKAWLITGSFKAYRNRTTPPPVLGVIERASSRHTYESRQYSAGAAWMPPRRYALDLNYAKIHLDTESGIINFPLPGGPSVQARRSLYLSHVHHAHGNFRVELHPKAVLFLGYSLVKDTADGRDRPFFLAPLVPSYPNFVFEGTDLVNVYPLSYHSPRVRVSVRLHRKLSWNASWEYYGYAEKFASVQDYHANLVTTSFRWTF